MDKRDIVVYISLLLITNGTIHAQEQQEPQDEVFEMEDIEFWEYFDLLEELDFVENLDDNGELDE